MANELPQPSLGDYVHLALRTGIAGLPVVGGPALEVFNQLIAPPIQRRRDEWLKGVMERLSALEQDNCLKIDDLASNDVFVSTITQATTIALRNHRKEKLDALRNAVLNTAIGRSPDDSKRELFLNFVDVFTVAR